MQLWRIALCLRLFIAPYFYIIQHIESGKFYVGVKYAENANPDNLLKFNGYQTSSKVIQQIILEDGLDGFIIRKIRVFETGEEALNYESRFLRRVNAAYNESFLNRSNNSISSLNIDCEKRKQTCLEKFGVENPLQSEEIKEKIKQTCLEKFGVEYSTQSEEVKEKIKQSFLENFGVENPMQSLMLKEKQQQSLLDNYGVKYPSQSEEIREKQKQNNLKKYGFENPFQFPEVKEKIRQNRNTLCNRSIVSEIRKYKDNFELKFGGGWFMKKQEVLDVLLEEIKITYGEL